jgi:uncharacterized damage-inducible protein DinB
MPATYSSHVIEDREIPRAEDPAYQHLLDIYASEINKIASVWRGFDDGVIDFRPHPKSMTVADEFKHELLSARRFFGGFLGLPEPDADAVLPTAMTVDACVNRMADLARARLPHLARGTRSWWDTRVAFFDVERPRLWVFWRRVLHSAHHRTQLTVYLRLLDRPVPAIYGPTADVTWTGADPTRSVDAARRA